MPVFPLDKHSPHSSPIINEVDQKEEPREYDHSVESEGPQCSGEGEQDIAVISQGAWVPVIGWKRYEQILDFLANVNFYTGKHIWFSLWFVIP